MPNGGEHYEQVGFCPRCSSDNITQRRRLHRRINWRCRVCNSLFERPRFQEAAVYSNTRYVSQHQVERVAARVNRRWGKRMQRRRKGKTFWTMLAILAMGLIVAYLYLAPNLPDQFRSTTLESAIIGLPVVEQMGNYPPESGKTTSRNKPDLGLTDAVNSTEVSPPSRELHGDRQVEPNLPLTLPHPLSNDRQEVPIRPATITIDQEEIANQPASTASEDAPRPIQLLEVTPVLPTQATATLEPTPIPTPTFLPPPNLRHLPEKELMLSLINQARTNAGLPSIELGDNIAAQLHAEDSLANCTSSHWGTDGLKPYMRYSVAGGYQSNGENGHGSDYCITSRDFYRPLGPLEQEVREAVAGWLNSSGHRRNILDMWHKKVNIGLAWDKYNFVAYQHFEGDYVEYAKLPSLEEGLLVIEGITKNGVRFLGARDLGVQVFFDPPPHPLARGQLSRTYCYSSGLQVASLREPLAGLAYWPTDSFTTTHSPCPDPYAVSASAPAPRSHREANAHWEEAYRTSNRMASQTIVVPWITASEWGAKGDQFSVTADLGRVISKHGNGVYTVVLWGKEGGEDLVISEYSIFYGVEPPDTYYSTE